MLTKNGFCRVGGIEKKEEPIQTAIRETYEETGLRISNPDYITKRDYDNQFKRVTVFYFTKEVVNPDIVIDGQEIVDAGWFDFEDLPSKVSPRLLDEIALYNNWKYGN